MFMVPLKNQPLTSKLWPFAKPPKYIIISLCLRLPTLSGLLAQQFIIAAIAGMDRNLSRSIRAAPTAVCDIVLVAPSVPLDDSGLP